MAEKEYIEREKIEKFFDSIYDCADLTFEPNDHCCAADDCFHCKSRETMNAIKKRILSIHAADVRPVVYCKDCRHRDPEDGKCDAGAVERAGCVFPAGDNYFCAYGEKREEI